MAIAVESLAQMIGLLPANEDKAAALDFLKRPDLTRPDSVTGVSDYASAEFWLRSLRRRQERTIGAGIATRGFPSLLAALEKLSPSAPVTITVYTTNAGSGNFWSDQNGQFVGFVLVERRSPEEEQERLEWLRRNLT
ncbi:hypothetical protein JJE66_21015 [Bradyrhizobium diazoefficiens]|uniref:hypothetical protein n=1 Tax=Bradyrhizobium diazoefficiens TaxID=1355477 RepID=UPI0019090BFF|nr:hypothetical protein [Bradyrhizobium diazoefficiens]MBK3663692.1 hypothetical protein [Bradyrhizobium diazoefficiens]